MANRIADFLVSTGAADEPYGLYLMEREGGHHGAESILVYLFDSDDFKRWPRRFADLFVPAAQLHSCKDEFGDVYTGASLTARIREAMHAYIEELPGHLRAEAKMDESFEDLEK